ncbi:MAG: thermonuclease family protein [Solimonas sp.]
MRVRLLAGLLGLALALALPAQAQPPSQSGARGWDCAARVLRVHDGDTLTVDCGDGGRPRKLRIANIDAPELHQAHGQAARRALLRQVDGQTVRVHSVAVDRYERAVVTLAVDGKDVGLRLVAAGHAWCGLRPSRACRAAQDEARRARRGLWRAKAAQPPWEWRQAHPRSDLPAPPVQP